MTGGPLATETRPRSAVPYAVVLAALACLYFASGKLGLSLAFVNASASPVWPPTGIALAAFLLLGPRVWPAILAAAFLTNITTAGNAATSVGIAIGNTLEGFVGATLVSRYASGTRAFQHPNDIFRFSVLAGVMSTAVSATIGVTSLALGGFVPWAGYGAVWLTWWLGDAAGALVVAPLFVIWSHEWRILPTLREGVELGALLLLLAGTGLLVFVGMTPFERTDYPLQALCFPPLLWAAFRFGRRETATAIVLLSATSIVGTLRGMGPFAGRSPNESLLLLQGFLGVASVMSLAVTAAVQGRKEVEGSIRRINVELEQRVAERTEQLWMANQELRGEVKKRAVAQHRLEKSEARLREAQRVARLGSWEWDIERNALWWSDELLSIYGIDPRSFNESYQAFLERVHPEDRERVEGIVSAALTDGRPFAFEHRILRPDGELRILLAQGGVILDKRQRPIRMMGTGQDITEHKRREEERATLTREQIARREAEEANRLKDEFLATLSHELRTPLNAIVGWADLLRGGTLDAPTTARAVETILRNVRIQSNLISDILDISRMTMGQLELATQAVDPCSVIESAIDTMRPAAHAKKIGLRSRLDREGSLVRGDPDRLQQVVWNLLSNAIKFTPEGGKVTISCRTEDGSVRIRVEDDGPGVDPEFLPYVFDPFRQRDSSGTRLHGGLGLGLAIVRRLVELHGGSVSARNREGAPGALFEIVLPTASTGVAAGDEDEGRGRGARPDRALEGKRILLVEDEPDSRELTAMLLSRMGADVRAVPSAAEALDALQAVEPDILISDIAMPGESGYDLIAKVRGLTNERLRTIPAIALTAYAGPEDATRSLRAGYQAHVSKPVEIQDLVRILLHALTLDG